MDHTFWSEKWARGETAFDEKTVNAMLLAHAERLGKPKRVLVPLAGKAADLRWLADKGHDVVGVEFVQEAIDAFFANEERKPTPHRLGAHDAYYANGVTLVRADIFDIKPESIGRFDAVYDRAALVALDPGRRDDYVRTLAAVVTGGTLLVALSYPEGMRAGPPHRVDETEVRRLFSKVTPLQERQLPSGMTETAYWVEP